MANSISSYLIHVNSGKFRTFTPKNFGIAKSIGATLVLDGNVYRLGSEKLTKLNRNEIALRILEAYQKNCIDIFKTITGEFSLCIFENNKFIAFRSLTSPHQIYYLGNFISNRLFPIVCNQGDFVFDENYLLRYLLQKDLLPYRSEVTPVKGIKRLQPQHMLIVKSASLQLERIEHKQFLNLNDPNQKIEEIAPRIHELLTQVIQDRLDLNPEKNIVCEISGGLDSSYVASIIGSRRKNISGYMYSYPHHPSHVFSEDCAKAVAAEYGIDFRIINPDEVLSCDLSLSQPYSDEPNSYFWQGAVFYSYIAKTTPENSLIFSGFASDQIFQRNPGALPWLLSKGQLKDFLKTLKDLSNTKNRSQLNLFYQSVLSLLPKEILLPLMKAFRNWVVNPVSIQDVDFETKLLEEISWLNLNARALQKRFLNEQKKDNKLLFGRDIPVHADLSYVVAPKYVMGPYLEEKNTYYESPFCDERMIDFLANDVSWNHIHDFKSPYKNLLREAQRGTVPEIVRTRAKNEFRFDGFLSKLLRRNQKYLRELIDGDMGFDLIKRDQLMKTFDELLFGKDSNDSRRLMALFGYLIWKRDFKKYCAEMSANSEWRIS